MNSFMEAEPSLSNYLFKVPSDLTSNYLTMVTYGEKIEIREITLLKSAL
jgi:hypothetical protein